MLNTFLKKKLWILCWKNNEIEKRLRDFYTSTPCTQQVYIRGGGGARRQNQDQDQDQDRDRDQDQDRNQDQDQDQDQDSLL